MKVGTPSATAYLVAFHVHRIACEPRLAGSVDPVAAGWSAELLSTSRHWKRAAGLAGWGVTRALLRRIEALYVPGLALHQALRKRELEQCARTRIQAGVRQVVVVGAGFDSLALRLCVEYPELSFWELDHPSTQAVKRGVVERRLGSAANLRFLPVELTEDDPWRALRRDPRFQSADVTLFVCEGVLMYLVEGQVVALLRGAPASGPAHFAFTFLASDARGRPGFAGSSGWVDAWLRRHQEPLRWGIAPARLAAFLDGAGWSLDACFDSASLRARNLRGDGSGFCNAAGELVAVARRRASPTTGPGSEELEP